MIETPVMVTIDMHVMTGQRDQHGLAATSSWRGGRSSTKVQQPHRLQLIAVDLHRSADLRQEPSTTSMVMRGSRRVDAPAPPVKVGLTSTRLYEHKFAYRAWCLIPFLTPAALALAAPGRSAGPPSPRRRMG